MRIAAGALVATVFAASAAQAVDVGACVTPKAHVDPATHRLVGKFIDVFETTKPGALPIWVKVAAPMPLRVVAVDGKYLQVEGGRDSPFKDDAPFGWVRAADVQGQDLRNCN